MTWMGPETAKPVVVPDIIGLEVSAARKIAWQAGIVLAAENPDGPCLRELTWPGEWTGTEPPTRINHALPRFVGRLVPPRRPRDART